MHNACVTYIHAWDPIYERYIVQHGKKFMYLDMRDVIF